MAGSILKLTVDWQNHTLVQFRGTVSSMPDCFQSNTLSLQVQVVEPTGDFSNPFSIVDLNGYGLRASVGETPTGASGGPAPLALQDTFVWDTDKNLFAADLALNTTGIDGFIGTAAGVIAYFELNLTNAGSRITILQTQFNLRAVVDELTSTVPTPADQFLTKAEVLALLSAKLDRLMKSPGNIYGREIGVADDGTPTDSILPL